MLESYQMLDIEEYQWAKQALRGLDFFSHCSDEDILGLVENLEKLSYKAGSTILFKGEISNRLYLVQSGAVGIWKVVNGEKSMVAELGPGKYFGEISLMTPTTATATVKANTDAHIFALSFESLEFSFRKNPEALATIQKKLEERKNQQSQSQNPSATPSQS